MSTATLPQEESSPPPLEFGSVNEAMAAAIRTARADWRKFVKEWEADERDE